MKDQPQKAGNSVSGSSPGLDSGLNGGGEKRAKIKPEVPPRRNPPPKDPLRNTPSDPSRTSSVSTSKDGTPISPGVESPDVMGGLCTTFSAHSLGNSSSSTPVPQEFEESGATDKAKGAGGPVSPKPTVTFDPNPTILLTKSDGSPMKIAAKRGVHWKKYGEGGENNPPQVNREVGSVPVAGSSTNKRGDEDAAAASEAGAERAKNDELDDCHLQDLYQQVKNLVASKPDDKENVNEDEAEDPSTAPMIWISKWVDYSDKYGLGYQLSDDSIGVLFNDFTKLMLLPDGENIHYIERGGQEHYHRLSDYPQTLYKKVTLLRYFRNYMNEHLLKAGAAMHPREGDELARIPSLKTYFRTRSAIIMHLTNGTLQINFFEDHTKIILCPLMGAVTYIDTKRTFRTFRLEMLMKYGCSVDLGNRIRYAQNMIQKLMLTKSGSSNKGGSAGAPPQSSVAKVTA